MKFNGYISYQTAGPLATQCDNAELFSIYFFFYLTGNKFVFMKCVFFINNLQRGESRTPAHNHCTKTTPGQFPQRQTGFLSAAAAAAAADLPRELQLLRGRGLLSGPVVSVRET